MRGRYKKKYIWAFIDGEPYVEVIQAALDNNMLVGEMKELLIRENPGYKVEFRVKDTKNIRLVSLDE